jgi:triosephosphate isomerase
MRKNIVAGNWKMNKTLPEGLALATELDKCFRVANPSVK